MRTGWQWMAVTEQLLVQGRDDNDEWAGTSSMRAEIGPVPAGLPEALVVRGSSVWARLFLGSCELFRWSPCTLGSLLRHLSLVTSP